MNQITNRQHEKFIVMISLPQDKRDAAKQELATCIDKLRANGIEVHETINKDLLARANEFDVVVVIAHRHDEHNTLVLPDGEMPLEEFLDALPNDFNKILDFISCNGATITEEFKQRFPNALIGVNQSTTDLNRRLYILPNLLLLYHNYKNVNYGMLYKGLNDELDRKLESKKEQQERTVPRIKLGKEVTLVYAPTAVRKSEPFVIKAIINQDEATGLFLKGSTVQLNKRIDRVWVELTIEPSSRPWVHIVGNTTYKQVTWQGGIEVLEFVLIVLPDFNSYHVDGRLKLGVNETIIAKYDIRIDINDQANNLIQCLIEPTIL